MTPIDIDQLQSELQGHPGKDFVNFLKAGYKEGFDLGIRDIPLLMTECKNNRSATTQPAVVKELIHLEVSKGYLLGPNVRPPFETYKISPIGIAEGKHSKKKRLIVDLSAPYNKSDIFSVNELINCYKTIINLNICILGHMWSYIIHVIVDITIYMCMLNLSGFNDVR